MIRRALAVLAGAFLLLIAVITRATLPAEYLFAHAATMLGGLVTCGAALVAGARRIGGIRSWGVFGVTWIGAIVAPAVASVIRSPTAVALGTGIGIGIVLGLVTSVGATWLISGLWPSLSSRATASEDTDPR